MRRFFISWEPSSSKTSPGRIKQKDHSRQLGYMVHTAWLTIILFCAVNIQRDSWDQQSHACQCSQNAPQPKKKSGPMCWCCSAFIGHNPSYPCIIYMLWNDWRISAAWPSCDYSKSHSMTTSQRSSLIAFIFDDKQSPMSGKPISPFFCIFSALSWSKSISQASPRQSPMTWFGFSSGESW